MIEPIVIKVVDKVPVLVSGPEYVVCDNSDYTVVWQLDEEWAEFEHRTMRVNYMNGTYEQVLFTGNTCALPAVPLPDRIFLGLFAGDIHTTRPVQLPVVRSATTFGGAERDPMPNGYAQAIAALEGKLDKNQGAENVGKALVIGEDGSVVPGEAQGVSSLPAMSDDTKGMVLTNDGESAAWGDVSEDFAPLVVAIDPETVSGVTTYTADKSSYEIMAASVAGKTVVANISGTGVLLPLVSDKYNCVFKGFYPNDNRIVTATVNNDKSVTCTFLPVTDDNAVHFTEQSLTAEQQAQARTNIGFTPVAKTDDMTQSVGLDAETGELYTAPGGGSTVQSDWNQNDETAADYVKNRPFYTTTEKATVDITWDGTTDGLVASSKGNYYKVSDDVFTEEQFIQLSYVTSGTDTSVSDQIDQGGLNSNGAVMTIWGGTGAPVIVSQEAVDSGKGVQGGAPDTFPEPGVYFPADGNVTRLYGSSTTEVCKTIDEKYLPYDGKMDKSNPVGSGCFSLNRLRGSEVGLYSFSEGIGTIASGNSSHAEGDSTTASGNSSHAEGAGTTASGNYSHAEGEGTTASGYTSHAEGSLTVAASQYQHVQGRHNIEDASGTYAHIVGNGDAFVRSNAHTLDWSGNAWFAGDVYIGSTSGTNKDDGSKKLATEEYVDAATSNPLAITSAAVGQIARITAVDDSGKPTAWEAVDMPSGDKEWTFIAEVDVTEDIAADVSEWTFTGLSYKELWFVYNSMVSSTSSASGLPVSINGVSTNQQCVKTGASGSTGVNGWTYAFLGIDGFYAIFGPQANSPTNYASNTIQATYNAVPMGDNDVINTLKVSSNPSHPPESGAFKVYGR